MGLDPISIPLLALALAGQGAPQQKTELAPSFSDFDNALAHNFTRGLFSRDNLEPLLIGSLATLAFVPLDDEISEEFQGTPPELGDSGEFIAAPITIAAVTGAVLLATPLTENRRYRSFSFSLAQAVILNNSLMYPLKLAVSRTRPDESDDHSFPSGHASNAFAVATVANHHYGWKLGIPLYAVAGLVAASRVERGSHFPTDVVFGAMLGYVAGRTAVHTTDRYARRGRSFTLVPSIGPHRFGLYVHVALGPDGP